jgi:hypothetical protein
MIEADYYSKSRDIAAQEANFSRFVLQHIPDQLSENLSSEIHETNRISDPYIFLINRDRARLQTPDGQDIDGFMDKDTDLGRLETVAFEQIQNWAMTADGGYSVWFSPPYDDRHPVSKIVVSKIMELDSDQAILFNRAILLDIDASGLLGIANQLISHTWLSDPELLRSVPLFPLEEEFNKWFDGISDLSDQFGQVSDGTDLSQKIATYLKVSQISDRTNHQNYNQIYEQAQRENLMGKHLGSCPPSSSNRDSNSKTPFSIFSGESWDGKYEEEGPCRLCGRDVPCGPCKVCETCTEMDNAKRKLMGE